MFSRFGNAAKTAAVILFAALSVHAPKTLAQSAFPSTGAPPLRLLDNESALCADPNQESETTCRAVVEGSWLFTVNKIHSSAVYFNAIASFTAGGVFLGTGSKDRLNPASPLYGTWKSIGHHRYSSTTYFFIFDPAHPNTEAVATLKADQVFELKDRNNLVGAGTVSICDLAGRDCTSVPDSGTQIRGSRILTADPTRLLGELPPK